MYSCYCINVFDLIPYYANILTILLSVYNRILLSFLPKSVVFYSELLQLCVNLCYGSVLSNFFIRTLISAANMLLSEWNLGCVFGEVTASRYIHSLESNLFDFWLFVVGCLYPTLSSDKNYYVISIPIYIYVNSPYIFYDVNRPTWAVHTLNITFSNSLWCIIKHFVSLGILSIFYSLKEFLALMAISLFALTILILLSTLYWALNEIMK